MQIIKPQRLNSKGFTLIEVLILIVFVAALSAVYWKIEVNRHTAVPANSSSSSQPSKVNCTSTKLTRFPDNNISFQMPTCWQAGVLSKDVINSSNQVSVPQPCDVLPTGTSPNCKRTENMYDAELYITVQPANSANIHDWVTSFENSLPKPDPQMYVLTTFAGQPAECSNPNNPNQQGKIPSLPELPQNIPIGLFIYNCYVLWDGKIYTIGPIAQDVGYTDIKQVYNLLNSIKLN